MSNYGGILRGKRTQLEPCRVGYAKLKSLWSSLSFTKEGKKCSEKSLLSKALISLTFFAAFAKSALATSTNNPASAPGLSFDSVKSFVSPLSETIAWFLWIILSCWEYLMSHPPAAILLSGLIAFLITYRGIHSQREIARLRETFSAIDNEIRDGDVIKTRTDFRNIKNKISESKESIAKYRDPAKEDDVKHAITLRTILNNYENLALGVRYNILDEEYLFRWTRTGLISDWNYLMPLVTAYRSAGSPNAYIEFEGLATSWQNNKSYRSGKAMKLPNKNTKVH